MSKIDLISQVIVDKLKTVTSLSNRVGLAVGGTEIDPINRDATRPFAWAVFVGAPVIDNSQIATNNVSITYNFVVKVITDYGVESELISTHFPLLEEIISTIIAGAGVDQLPFHTWSFDGMSLESLDPDRMVWVMNFSMTTAL